MSAAVERVLGRLHGVKRLRNGKAVALCPVHDDRRPSLSVDEGDGCALIVCRSCGANGADVAEAVGLPTAALFDDYEARKRTWKPRPKRKPKVRDALIAAADEGGEEGLREAVGIMVSRLRERP